MTFPVTLLQIAIHLDPNVAAIGPLLLSWHGVFSAIGVIVGVSLGVRVAADAGADEDKAYSLALWSVAGGIVGARLFHVIDNWGYYAANPAQIIMINEGGIAIYGAVVGGVLTGVAYARWSRLPVAALADGGAVGLIIGAAIGRIGDVINGEHWGRPLDAPWAVVYTHPDTLGQPGVPVHLAVGYEMVWNLALFGLLIWMRPRFAGQGLMFWTFVLLYSVGRFWTSFYRLDAQVLFGLTQAQVVAVVGIVLGIVMLAWMLWLRPRPPVGDPIDSENTPRSDEVHSPV